MAGNCFVEVLKSKLHRARVTGANLNYEGSLSISEDLMRTVGIVPFEKVLCGNQTNGARFETYVIPVPAGTGQIVLNGAAARLGEVGDRLTILASARIDLDAAASWKPSIAALSETNQIATLRHPKSAMNAEAAAAPPKCDSPPSPTLESVVFD